MPIFIVWIGQAIAWVFSGLGLFFTFIYKAFNIVLSFIAAKITLGAVGVQTLIIVKTFVFTIAYVSGSIFSIVYIYNLYFNIIDYVNGYMSNSSLLSCFSNLFACSGIAQGFNDGFSLFYGALSSFLLLKLLSLVLKSTHKLGDEIWKLGMLVTNGAKASK